MLLVTPLASRIMRWLQDFRKVCIYRTGSYEVTFLRLFVLCWQQVSPKRLYLFTRWFVVLFTIYCQPFTQFLLSSGGLVALSCKVALTQPRCKVHQLSISQASRVCLIPYMELLISQQMKQQRQP